MPADIPADQIAVVWLFDNTTEKLNDSLKSPEGKLRLGRGQYVIERLIPHPRPGNLKRLLHGVRIICRKISRIRPTDGPYSSGRETFWEGCQICTDLSGIPELE
jgi:hypothetical protein